MVNVGKSPSLGMAMVAPFTPIVLLPAHRHTAQQAAEKVGATSTAWPWLTWMGESYSPAWS